MNSININYDGTNLNGEMLTIKHFITKISRNRSRNRSQFPQPFPIFSLIIHTFAQTHVPMKYITIIDIAKELGISKSTVSRALSGDTHNVKPDTMKLIRDTADRLGYKRNEIAVNLRHQRTRNIGVIIPEVVTSFFMNFIQQTQKELRRCGYRTIITVSNEDPEQEAENLLMLEQCRVEGILMSVCHKNRNIDLYNRMMSQGIPIVFFDRKVDGIKSSQVRIDDYLMAFFMVESLIRSGCRKIVHLAGPDYISNGYDRHRGYRAALEKFSIEYDERYVLKGGLTAEEGGASIENFLSEGLEFDGVFGFTETATLGAKSVLQKMNYRIPEDVSLCCISGTALCTLVHPTITAVEQPVFEMASLSCKLLLEQIADLNTKKESIILRGTITKRESTR